MRRTRPLRARLRILVSEPIRLALPTMLSGLLAGTALAGGGAALTLQKADFPAGAVSGVPSPGITHGPTDKEYASIHHFLVGGHEEEVTSDVVVFKNPADLESDYKITLGGYTHLPHSAAYRLPAYGDEQVAEYEPEPGMSEVVVHRGNLVWMVTVQNCSHFAPSGCRLGTTPPKLTAAQALAELKKYALKQKARIGSGQRR
jgi:hypothetical protein